MSTFVLTCSLGVRLTLLSPVLIPPVRHNMFTSQSDHSVVVCYLPHSRHGLVLFLNTDHHKLHYLPCMLNNLHLKYLESSAKFYHAIQCGLVIRIRRSHRRGPGSIPGVGISLFLVVFQYLVLIF